MKFRLSDIDVVNKMSCIKSEIECYRCTYIYFTAWVKEGRVPD